MATVRRATASWSGDLLSGSGTVSAYTTGLFTDLPVSWASRTEEPEGRTSPEELLAAAHAACYSMAFSNTLAKAGTPPEHLHVAAEVAFEKDESGWSVTHSDLQVIGRVPGCSVADFERMAAEARDGCPISRALAGNVKLSVDATLEEPEET
ncbi:MAG TPA: OsmC family peroxiredoxin [Candidatus Limnocylindria bacterium]|jgi:osmotically inducible protein OsmC